MIWYKDPKVLIEKAKVLELWPAPEMTFAEKINAMVRLIIVLTIAGFVLTKAIRIIIVGIITLAVLSFLYYTQADKKEGFANLDPREPAPQKPIQLNEKDFYEATWKNPFSNVLLPEINDDPNRKMAKPAFHKPTEELIQHKTRKMVEELNPTIANIDKKLFQDLGDAFEFRNSLIPFNSSPVTTIPNDQKAFAEFLYGNMPSCKSGADPKDCSNIPPRIGSVYN
jgi:hypothetical protein